MHSTKKCVRAILEKYSFPYFVIFAFYIVKAKIIVELCLIMDTVM